MAASSSISRRLTVIKVSAVGSVAHNINKDAVCVFSKGVALECGKYL